MGLWWGYGMVVLWGCSSVGVVGTLAQEHHAHSMMCCGVLHVVATCPMYMYACTVHAHHHTHVS